MGAGQPVRQMEQQCKILQGGCRVPPFLPCTVPEVGCSTPVGLLTMGLVGYDNKCAAQLLRARTRARVCEHARVFPWACSPERARARAHARAVHGNAPGHARFGSDFDPTCTQFVWRPSMH